MEKYMLPRGVKNVCHDGSQNVSLDQEICR